MTPYYADEAAGIVIYHGDALEVLPQLDGIGAIVTDPPYSSGGQFRGDRMQRTAEKYVQSGQQAIRPEFSGDNRDQRAFLVWCSLWLNCARNSADPGAVAVSFIDWRQLPTMSDAMQCAGWTWRGIATWWKPGIRMQSGGFSGSAEYLLWGTHGPMDRHEGYAQNVFAHAPVPGDDRIHIAEKPEPVVRWALSIVKPGALVVAPFMGSGTTLAGCKSLGLPCVGIELEERYCEDAARRLESVSGPSAQAALPWGFVS